jgi:uncharacterized membrane protein
MSELDRKIIELEARLESLVRTQIDFQVEVTAIRRELTRLRSLAPGYYANAPVPPPQPAPPRTGQPSAHAQEETTEQPPYVTSKLPPIVEVPSFMTLGERTATDESNDESKFSAYFSEQADNARANLEEFIGKNLISKIGILILILGVGIGAKYAIDNNLISPLTRIVLGYIFGFGLLCFAVKLKTKYHNFSAVLLSGGMAIMYFITYFAYSTYQLIGQPLAFVLMVMFTAFTVMSAIVYDRQIIAHIGLIGAYAVPFLLSSDSGRYTFLFTYMSVINAGILAISIKRYWSPIFYTSSFFTWVIFYSWFVGKYDPGEHFYLALTFVGIFFAIFYATKVFHGLAHNESNHAENLISIVGTGFIFYWFCFAIGDVPTSVWNYAVFFSYIALAGLAILITSYRFYGRVFVYLAYPFTWLIFGNWYLSYYDVNQHFALAAVYSSVFFLVFYGATLIYRLVTEELSMVENTALILTNSFVFYGFSYAVVDSRASLRGYEGLFTVAHAAFHSLVAQVASRIRPLADDVVQVLTVLILTFATIAVPVQLDGNAVTVIWAAEAAILFVYGRLQKIELFEYFSYPLMWLALASMALDWITSYSDRTPYVSEFNQRPIFNGDVITALVFVTAFAVIFVVNRDQRYEPAIDRSYSTKFGYVVGGVALFVLYNAFRIEIGNYFHLKYVQEIETSTIRSSVSSDYSNLNVLWQIIYTMLFLAGTAAVNLRKAGSRILAFASSGLSLATLFVFATVGMLLMHELRVSYMTNESAGIMNVAIRFVAYSATAVLLFSLFHCSRDALMTEQVDTKSLRLGFEAIFTTTLFITTSCELVNLMAQLGIADGTKLGLSILWGVFALGMVIVGIAQDKKYLRIAAIVLLAITLVKLFFYDITELDTIPKTILFISLGILLLVISFLYNKYKHVILQNSGQNSPE